jgi:hypothetical protein
MNIFEREAIQLGIALPTKRLEFLGLKWGQTDLAPEDEIIIHPIMLDKLLTALPQEVEINAHNFKVVHDAQ